jgi:hypothetical protein
MVAMDQSFEFKVTIEAPGVNMDKFTATFPAEFGKRISSEQDLGNVTCKVTSPRDSATLQIGMMIQAVDGKVEASLEMEFDRHASAILGRGKFSWHAKSEGGHEPKIAMTMIKSPFAKLLQKRVSTAIQDAVVKASCAPVASACAPAQQEAKPISCPRCGYSIQPGTIKQGRCPYCKVKL